MFLIWRKKTILFVLAILITFLFILLLCWNHFPLTSKEVVSHASYPADSSIVTDELEDKIRHIYHGKEKIAYLTFDDGPIPKATPKILDILDRLDVKANFFVVGKHVKESPELVKREWESGHFIANHGYSHHDKKLYQSKSSFLNEITQTDLAISEAIGQPYKSHLFRFPKGSIGTNYRQEKKAAIGYLKEIDYTYIDWNCLNHDSVKKYSDSQLIQNLKDTSKGKSTLVILMHDTADVNNTYDILEESILYLKKEGYEFHTFYDFF